MIKFRYFPLGITNNWYWDPTFPDLSQNLRMMACSSDYGTEIYRIETPEACGGYTYGYFLARSFSIIGIDQNDSFLLGIFFICVLVIAISWASAYLQICWQISPILLFLTFSSPGIWLMSVHGSFDIPVFALLLFSFAISLKGKNDLAFVLIAITVFMKFFTLPLLILLVLKDAWNEKALNFRVGSKIVVLFLAIVSTIQDMARIDYTDSSYRMAQGIFHVFGIFWLPNWLKVF